MSEKIERSPVEQNKVFLRDRKMAYTQVFNKDSLAVQFVLADLARFCRATTTTFDMQKDHVRLEGRREVFLRISQHLGLDVEELFKLSTKGHL